MSLGEFRRSLHARQSRADDGDRSVGDQLCECGAKPFSRLEVCHRNGVLERPWHGCRHNGRAAHGVHGVVVVDHAPRSQQDAPFCGIDARRGVDDELHALPEQRSVVDGGSAAARDDPGRAAKVDKEAGKSAEHQPPLRPEAPKPTRSASSTTIRSVGSASAR